jgi:hypothetical protein
MKNRFPNNKLNIKCGIYTLVVFMALCHNISAQNQNISVSSKTDTLNKAATTSQAPVRSNADTRPISQRIGFDITTSFWINPSSTFFEFSPVVVYNFPRIISIGTGPAYIYNRDRINQVNLSGWGGKVFSRAQLTKWFYAYTEYQGINNQYISGINSSTNEVTKSKEYVDSWFLSLGVNIRITKRHGINMQALYDLLYNKETSPYYGAWTYRIGFGF